MPTWVVALAQTPAAQALRRRLEQGGVLSCDAIHPAAQPFLAALLHALQPRRPLLVVTEGLKTQERFQEDLETWLRLNSPAPARTTKTPKSERAAPVLPAVEQPLFHPAWEVFPHEGRLPHVDVISERLATLAALMAGAPSAEPVPAAPEQEASGPGAPPAARRRKRPAEGPPAPVIVTSVAALMQRTFAPAAMAQRLRRLRRGETLDPLDLVEWLEAQGYEPEAKVTQKGELSLRGGILDVFSPVSPWPVRCEFFGNEIESLRFFDPITQLSREETTETILSPAGEMGLLKRLVTPAVGEGAGAGDAGQASPPSAVGTLLDYLSRETMVLLCEPESLDEHAEQYAQQVPPGDPLSVGWPELQQRLESGGLTVIQARDLGTEMVAAPAESAEPPVVLGSLEAFRPLEGPAAEPQVAEVQRREFFAQVHRWLRQGYAVHVFCNNEGERQRFGEIWAEYGAAEPPAPAPEATASRPPTLHLGAMARGFIWEAARVVVVTDAEIFGRYKVLRPRRLKSPHAQALRSMLDIDFSELEEGDYVVHLQHGIGRYAGLQPMPGQVNGPECLVIEYAPPQDDEPSPRLYVPVSEAHLVSKYIGAGRARPPLSTLGGTRWHKTKAQAEVSIRDLAAELLSIQAQRALQGGFSFGADTSWQRDFESAFLYEETPDQQRAIQETKRDMEAPKPMDRLICGDVGFGKTEVALRAAFKAVMSGKQVAVLVPTTVLAQQHFNTFRERMADYPVRVELLSRFRSRREQQRILRDLAAGGVDIIIGTHRLVQGDVAFKDLALVVVDEEQRFGVLHKEKLKRLRHLVDILTLSATPIPRTLYLALSGARDMSTIETPPQDRLPVKTIVARYDERLIRDAIRQELQREGQVFYLHNRVHDIAAVADRLRELVPDARIVAGHGQMDDDELEEVMTRFVNGQADVLVSTTIIESGLDIPNANTIIIDRADRFGLSDLYQLRGRVGRYKHQAYAYLLLPRHASLLLDARKRLSAIKQYATLGSGFKIAMRDLEIRGAGNLLGPQQSGHITAVGFELYCQLLKQSVAALKGEKVPRRIEVPLRLDFIVAHPAEADPELPAPAPRRAGRRPVALDIEVPRETWTFGDSDAVEEAEPPFLAGKTAAWLPLSYIPDSRQRIEVYRKLADASDPADLERLAGELRDRFGPPPRAAELLLELTGLKLLAAARGVAALESKEGKLMLTRQGDFVMAHGKFPRLTGRTAEECLGQIRKVLMNLK